MELNMQGINEETRSGELASTRNEQSVKSKSFAPEIVNSASGVEEQQGSDGNPTSNLGVVGNPLSTATTNSGDQLGVRSPNTTSRTFIFSANGSANLTSSWGGYLQSVS